MGKIDFYGCSLHQYTIADLNNIGTDDFSYSDLAKHWSEMKGFALGLQFNRLSPVTDEQFAPRLHGYRSGVSWRC